MMLTMIEKCLQFETQVLGALKGNIRLKKSVFKRVSCIVLNYIFLFVFPVDDSAILDCQFSDFYHTPPQGFEKILFEQQIF